MLVTIERNKDFSYNLTKYSDDFPNMDSQKIEITCNDFNALVKNLSIYLESKYITVLEAA